MEGVNWLTGRPPYVAHPVHLGRVDAQRRGRLRAEDRRLLLDPGIVAEDALGPGVDAVVPRPLTARRAGSSTAIVRLVPLGIGQHGVGLVVVPDVGVGTPRRRPRGGGSGSRPGGGSPACPSSARRRPSATSTEPSGNRQLPCSSRPMRPLPGTARNRSAVAPSAQSSDIDAYRGSRPAAGRWSRVEANRPVWLSRRGKSVFAFAAGLRTRR